MGNQMVPVIKKPLFSSLHMKHLNFVTFFCAVFEQTVLLATPPTCSSWCSLSSLSQAQVSPHSPVRSPCPIHAVRCCPLWLDSTVSPSCDSSSPHHTSSHRVEESRGGPGSSLSIQYTAGPHFWKLPLPWHCLNDFRQVSDIKLYVLLFSVHMKSYWNIFSYFI